MHKSNFTCFANGHCTFQTQWMWGAYVYSSNHCDCSGSVTVCEQELCHSWNWGITHTAGTWGYLWTIHGNQRKAFWWLLLDASQPWKWHANGPNGEIHVEFTASLSHKLLQRRQITETHQMHRRICAARIIGGRVFNLKLAHRMTTNGNISQHFLSPN